MAKAKVATQARRLRRSSTIAGVGDGVVAVAIPLLAASITHDPLAISAVVAAQHLPWALVAVVWPRLRTDRRTLIGLIDAVRAIALALLAVRTLSPGYSVLDVQLAAFVLGLGEALTDGTEADAGDVAGLTTRGMVGVAIIGLPLGGFLYELEPLAPFLFEIFAFALAGLFALLVPRPVTPAEPDEEELPTSKAVGSGTVTVAAAIAAVAASAVLGVLVLFALDDLGLGAPAFGVLLAGLALSSAAGAFVAPEVGGAFGVKAGMIVALLVAAAGHATASQVADPERPIAGAVALGIAAGAGMIAAVLARALLQLHAGRPVRGPMLQHFHLAVWSAIPVGAVLGGWFASQRSVHEVLLLAAFAWVVAALVAALARPAKKTQEIV